MALLGTVLGIGTALNTGLGALNSGTCGKKCHGIGKTLTNCRRKREEDCRAVEAQKNSAAAAAEAAELRAITASAVSNIQRPAAAVGSGGINQTVLFSALGLGGIGILALILKR